MKLPPHAQMLEAISYDPETGLFTKPGWRPLKGNADARGYMCVSVRNQNYRAHRLAWYCMTGSWPRGELDHINGVKDDNRWANLRMCTHQQNNHNQGIRRNNSSGIKGVYWSKRQRKWRGQVCLNYQIHHTKGFEDIGDAAAAVRALREELHGEFANQG